MTKIPEEGLDLRFTREGNAFSELVADSEEMDFSVRKVDVSCRVAKVREKIFIEGSLEALLDQQCCRCLEIAQVPVRTAFRYVLIPEGSQGSEILPAEFGVYREDRIDLDPLIYEQIVLQIPMKVLCMDDCKGLCPRCGVNLNVTKCDCLAESADERFLILKDWKIDNPSH
ncbi:MAG: DUF177 domain-containing protein [Deltaproteobacteria bacterium]|nr:DUF177 domain-containing protein [Deltaproteobacteria bacterium]